MEKEIIEDKIGSVISLLEKLKQVLQEHSTNKKLQEFLFYAAEKKAEEVVELAISINQELLKSKQKMSLSYYDSFIDLQIFNVFGKEELRELASTAGFRNRLAHEYLVIDPKLALLSMEKILRIYPPYLIKVKKLLSGK